MKGERWLVSVYMLKKNLKDARYEGKPSGMTPGRWVIVPFIAIKKR